MIHTIVACLLAEVAKGRFVMVCDLAIARASMETSPRDLVLTCRTTMGIRPGFSVREYSVIFVVGDWRGLREVVFKVMMV